MDKIKKLIALTAVMTLFASQVQGQGPVYEDNDSAPVGSATSQGTDVAGYIVPGAALGIAAIIILATDHHHHHHGSSSSGSGSGSSGSSSSSSHFHSHSSSF